MRASISLELTFKNTGDKKPYKQQDEYINPHHVVGDV